MSEQRLGEDMHKQLLTMTLDEILAPELIDKVIGLLDTLKDLKTCRLVSKQWNFIATRAVQGHPSWTLKLSTEKELRDLLLCCGKGLTTDIPFSAFDFNLNNMECSALIVSFLSTFGPAIQKLRLQSRNAAAMPTSFLALSPNLRVLELDIRNFVLDQTELPTLQLHSLTSLKLRIRNTSLATINSLHILRQSTPSLQEVVIKAHKPLGLVAQIIYMYSDVPILKLREVRLVPTNEDDINFFREADSKNLQLTELYVVVKHDSYSAARDPTFDYDRVRSIFFHFLETQSVSLKMLNVTLFDWASGFRFPPLPELRSLRLSNCTKVEHPFAGMMASQFPNLCKLELTNFRPHYRHRLQNWSCLGTESFVGVNHLEITEYQLRTVQFDFDVLFPSVTSLSLKVFDDALFGFFLERFTHVKNLRLNFNDSVKVVGLNICHSLGGSGYPEKEDAEYPPYVISHGLALYKELETLDLGKFKFSHQESPVCVLVALAAVKAMKPLQLLKMCNKNVEEDQLAILKEYHKRVILA